MQKRSIFIFFQAEDGIRDLIVTGVQTCALPISMTQIWLVFSMETTSQICVMALEAGIPAFVRVPANTPEYISRVLDRSEERRVGEEGRSRGAPYHLKKKNIV